MPMLRAKSLCYMVYADGALCCRYDLPRYAYMRRHAVSSRGAQRDMQPSPSALPISSSLGVTLAMPPPPLDNTAQPPSPPVTDVRLFHHCFTPCASPAQCAATFRQRTASSPQRRRLHSPPRCRHMVPRRKGHIVVWGGCGMRLSSF